MDLQHSQKSACGCALEEGEAAGFLSSAGYTKTTTPDSIHRAGSVQHLHTEQLSLRLTVRGSARLEPG